MMGQILQKWVVFFFFSCAILSGWFMVWKLRLWNSLKERPRFRTLFVMMGWLRNAVDLGCILDTEIKLLWSEAFRLIRLGLNPNTRTLTGVGFTGVAQYQANFRLFTVPSSVVCVHLHLRRLSNMNLEHCLPSYCIFHDDILHIDYYI